MFYEQDEICICKCGYKDIAENLYIDPNFLCPICPKCGRTMSVQEEE